MRPRSRFRSTLAVVAAVGLALPLAACGATPEADDGAARVAAEPSDDIDVVEDPSSDTDTRVDEPDAGDAPSEPAPTDARGDCSAQGHEVDVVEADLPAEVATMRDFLVDAALRCDEQLLATAANESDQFTFSFGDGTDPVGHWWDLEAAGEQPFLRLAQVLATTPSLADGGEIVVWPRVHTGRPEDTTAEAWEEVSWTDDPQREAEQAGGYLGWRVGISEDGQWRFFVAGD